MELVGPGPIGLAGPTSQVFTTPFPHYPGEKARDKVGNEYVFCDFTGSAWPGVLVQINERYQASPLLGTNLIAARVGVVSCTATSNNGGWVQIYGVHLAVQSNAASDALVSDGTVAYYLIPQTSVSTPSGTLSLVAREAPTSVEGSSSYNRIFGMWLADAATVSDFTSEYGDVPSSAASGPSTAIVESTDGSTSNKHTGVSYAVFLNYPYVLGISETVGLHNATS